MRQLLILAATTAALAAVLAIVGTAPVTPVAATDSTLAIAGDFTAGPGAEPSSRLEPDNEEPAGENQDGDNKPPVFASGSGVYTYSTLENYGPRISAGAFQISDPEGDALTFALAGADAAHFVLGEGSVGDEVWLALEFNGTPDYESPADANGDNVHEVTVQASDGNGTTEKPVRFTVRDVDEAPVITGLAEVSFPESSGTDVGQYTVADPEGEEVTLTLGGTDAGSFTFTEGTLRFNAVPDYETKSSYSVTFTSPDGTNTGRLDVTVTITDLDETTLITLSGSETLSIVENSSNLALETYTATDPEGGQVAWSLEGVDEEYFSIAGGVLSLNSSPDYETKIDYGVTVKAATGSKSTARAVRVTVIDVNEAPEISGPVAVNLPEHTTVVVGQYTASDPDGELPTLTLGGTDAASFTFAVGTLAFDAEPDYETKSSYSVTFTASDGVNIVTLDVTITIIDMGEVSGLRVTPQFGSLQVSVEWDDDAVADYYLVRWQPADSIHGLNQGVRPTSSNAQIKVADYGDHVVQVEACHEAGCGPNVSQQVTVDGGAFCNRTPAVRNAIMDAGPYVADCTAFTAENLADITRPLSLFNYQLTALKAGDFDGLTKLRGLDLSVNRLSELPEGLFDDLTSLTWLRLNDNRLTEIPVDAFSNLTKLRSLHLGRNRLTEVPADMIDDNSRLRILTLSNNHLTSIPAGLLENRSNLRTLHVNGNRLTTLPAGLFEDLTNIQELKRDDLVNPFLCDRLVPEQNAILDQLTDISDCKLVTHDDVALALGSIPFVAVCDRTTVVRNTIVSMVPDVSDCANVTEAHLTAVTGTLLLNEKEITTLKLGDLDGLTGLNEVNLRDNGLSSLPIGLFRDLSNARTVQLSNNDLTTLNGKAFFGMDKLRSVALTDNALRKVPAGLFHGHTNLQQIFLDGNSLTGIRPDTFDGLTDLRTLHLHDNALPGLPKGVFADLNLLETLKVGAANDLRFCEKPLEEQTAVLAALPANYNCKMVTYADLAPYARQYNEDNHIIPYQQDHPWLHEVWFDIPVDFRVRRPGGPAGWYVVGNSAVSLVYPHHKGREILYHELAHHYTFHNEIHEDDPTARLSMLTAWLYFADQKDRLGHPANIDDGIAGTLWAWVVKGEDAEYVQKETYAFLASYSAQEIPQWFFDTYATDGTLATVDLDRLWADLRVFKYKSSTLFGGYCSIKEGYEASTSTDLRNPWVDGGCVNRRPQELSATAAAAGELSVSWKAPLWNGKPTIDRYVVQWKSGDQEYDATRQALVTDLGSLSHKITGLTTGTEYTVRVAAVNQLGTADFVDNHGHARTAETTAEAG